MTEPEAIERRLRAVERAVTEEEFDGGVGAASGDGQNTGAVEDRLSDLDERVSELEAATQALRGYVGEVRSVNRDVEQRAEAALAAVDNLEDRIADATRPDGSAGRSGSDAIESATDARPGLDPASHAPAATGPGGDGERTSGPEMPVPGALDEPAGNASTDPERTNHADEYGGQNATGDRPDDGLFDRVRDAL